MANSAGVSLGALAAQLGANTTTMHNFVATLVADGYLAQARPRGPYVCGPRVIALAERVRSQRENLATAATPWMRWLQAQIDETVHLSILIGHEAVDLLLLEASQPLRFATSVGNRLPLHASAAGKTLIAWREPDEVQQLLHTAGLPKYTPVTLTSLDAIRTELRCVQVRGYAVNMGESDPGLRCIAGPIRDRHGAVVAALSLSAPAARFPGESIHHLNAVVRKAVDGISQAMCPPNEVQRSAQGHPVKSHLGGR